MLITKKITKYSLSTIFLSIIMALAPVPVDFSSTSQAQAGAPLQGPTQSGATLDTVSGGGWWQTAQEGGLDQVGQAYGGGGVPQDIRYVVVDIIKIVLGFLGIIAVVLIIYAGFKWMLSRGNEEAVGDAKKILIAGIIGLVIILSAYVIANFVINQIYGAATGAIFMNY